MSNPSPPYDMPVHPKYEDVPFDDLPGWLQNRLLKYEPDTDTASVDDTADVAEDVAEDGDGGDDGDYPQHKGGGYYLLSDGQTIRGKDEAEEAEADL